MTPIVTCPWITGLNMVHIKVGDLAAIAGIKLVRDLDEGSILPAAALSDAGEDSVVTPTPIHGRSDRCLFSERLCVCVCVCVGV